MLVDLKRLQAPYSLFLSKLIRLSLAGFRKIPRLNLG
jgi:hypothetical protein